MQKQAKAANAEPSLATSTGSNGRKEFFLDFVMIQHEGTKFTMEWNAWRIMSSPGGAIGVQFAMRGKATPDASEAVLAKLTKDFEKVGTAKALCISIRTRCEDLPALQSRLRWRGLRGA
jgi:hypothetical protein